MTIKHANLDSLEEIVALNTTIFSPLYEWPVFTLPEYQERLRDTRPFILVAEDNGKIVANSISFEKDGYWYIWILGVSVEYRKQGIATRLFETNEAHAKELGYQRIRIKMYDVSKEMLTLVDERGYNIIETTEYENPKRWAFVVELDLK